MEMMAVMVMTVTMIVSGRIVGCSRRKKRMLMMLMTTMMTTMTEMMMVMIVSGLLKGVEGRGFLCPRAHPTSFSGLHSRLQR